MDQVLELLRLIETLPAAWNALLGLVRDVAYGLLPPELDTWLAANEWVLWVAVLALALFLVVALVGNLAGGE